MEKIILNVLILVSVSPIQLMCRCFSGRALKQNPYLLPIDVCSSGGRRGREAGWKFQGALHGVSRQSGTHQYAQEPAMPYNNTQHEISTSPMPILGTSSSCASYHLHMARKTLLAVNLLSQQAHPSHSTFEDEYLFSTNIEENHDKILFFLSLTLANILTSIKVNFHMNCLNENRRPLWAPEAEAVTVILVNLR